MKKLFNRAGLVAVSALASAPVFAAGELVAEVTAKTTEAKADIGTAGVAIISVVVAIAVIAWIRRVIK